MAKQRESVVYLLCLSRALAHSKHYIGSSQNLDRRFKEHCSGRGSKFTQAVVRAGIAMRIAATWDGERYEERRKKLARNAARWCPFCRDEFLARDRARRKAKRLAKKREQQAAPQAWPIAA
ncbi:MAG: GIY-YIG nuclease family protein [Pyrinomonadaceae bacterium]